MRRPGPRLRPFSVCTSYNGSEKLCHDILGADQRPRGGFVFVAYKNIKQSPLSLQRPVYQLSIFDPLFTPRNTG